MFLCSFGASLVNIEDCVEITSWRQEFLKAMKANQGQVGWNFEQPGLVEDVSAQDRGVGTG